LSDGRIIRDGDPILEGITREHVLIEGKILKLP